MFTEEDFPLIAIGCHVWSKRRLFPLLVADSPIIAAQVTAVLNTQAQSERPDLSFASWISMQ